MAEMTPLSLLPNLVRKMRNNLVLTMSVLDQTTKNSYTIPQRGANESETFDTWDMTRPGFYVTKRSIANEEINLHFVYQSIWVEGYFKDPDGKELLFKFIGSNDPETNSACTASVLDGETLFLPEFLFSLNDFDLDKLFALSRPIVQLYQIKSESGKEYILELNNE